MKKSEFQSLVVLIAYTFGFAMGVFATKLLVIDDLEYFAIHHHCAQRSPTTGKFEWIDVSTDRNKP